MQLSPGGFDVGGFPAGVANGCDSWNRQRSTDHQALRETSTDPWEPVVGPPTQAGAGLPQDFGVPRVLRPSTGKADVRLTGTSSPIRTYCVSASRGHDCSPSELESKAQTSQVVGHLGSNFRLDANFSSSPIAPPLGGAIRAGGSPTEGLTGGTSAVAPSALQRLLQEKAALRAQRERLQRELDVSRKAAAKLPSPGSSSSLSSSSSSSSSSPSSPGSRAHTTSLLALPIPHAVRSHHLKDTMRLIDSTAAAFVSQSPCDNH